MTMLDSTLAYFLKGLKIRSKDLTADEALKAAAELKQFFAVELHYKGNPIRLIVAASSIPEGLQLTAGNKTREPVASPSVAAQ